MKRRTNCRQKCLQVLLFLFSLYLCYYFSISENLLPLTHQNAVKPLLILMECICNSTSYSRFPPFCSIIRGDDGICPFGETTIGIVMRHLLYLTILADHDAVVAEMVTTIVVEMGCVGDICMCPYRQNQSTGTYCHPYEIERFPIHLFYFISF